MEGEIGKNMEGVDTNWCGTISYYDDVFCYPIYEGRKTVNNQQISKKREVYLV